MPHTIHTPLYGQTSTDGNHESWAPSVAKTVIVCLRLVEKAELDAPHAQLGSLRRTNSDRSCSHRVTLLGEATPMLLLKKHLLHEIKGKLFKESRHNLSFGLR